MRKLVFYVSCEQDSHLNGYSYHFRPGWYMINTLKLV